jgi:cell division septum initiation protein DivIVA
MLDTNIVSELARNPQGAVARRIAEVGADAICVSIITAAEEASAEIRADALAGSERIRAEAREHADRHVTERKLEAERLLAEAEEATRGLRAAAEAYATRCRHDAEEEAERIVTEAEAQAFELVQAAQRESNRIADDSKLRLEELEREAKVLEARRAFVLDQLRDIAAQLFEVDGKAA